VNVSLNLKRCIKEIDQAARELQRSGSDVTLNYDLLAQNILDAMGVEIRTQTRQIVAMKDEDDW
jgi:hypothetical protein